MSIRKINSISNMAVFKLFDWDNALRDRGNNKLQFRKLNIIYGRNYSGKTTLSRIVRSLETSHISDKYFGASFQVEIENDGIITPSNLATHSQTIRVFNDDFVRDNLRFLINEEEDVRSFAILGDRNIDIEKQIASKGSELGSEEPSVGLLGQQKQRQSLFDKASKAVEAKRTELDSLLRKKANNEIKTNPLYKDVNYNIRKIQDDIIMIQSESFKDIVSSEVFDLQELLKDEAKSEVPTTPARSLNFQILMDEAKVLVERQITLSNPIRELLEDSLLESWVRTGIAYHKDRRSTCGFCGNILPPDLMDRLNRHFSKESEGLRSDIEGFIIKIEEQLKASNKLLIFNPEQFYASEKEAIYSVEKQYNEFSNKYKQKLNKLIEQLTNRLSSISKPLVFEKCEDISAQFEALLNEYNRLVRQTNEKTNTLSKSQNEARQKLRLHEVSTFLKTIGYPRKKLEISDLEKKKVAAEHDLNKIKTEVAKCKVAIEELKAQLKDEKKGAEQVNRYLRNYFGHDALELHPIGIESENEKFKFEIQRHGKKAYHLSEGECSLVSFCYFIAKLDDINTKGNDPIIWIDDPVSSLDANHVFFIYSLINSEIVKAKKFKQLFISTHSLDFLKYLKRLRIASKETFNILVQRCGRESTIIEMPDYMTKYVTEFNYLFHQIYRCANVDIAEPESSFAFYDFGNNARKYLELLLAFKFPNPNRNEDEKLECFLGETCIESMLIDRINNEYSHLFGVFERGITPIDVPEMKKAAQFLLDKTYQHDNEQYNALCESIGEPTRER